MIVGIGLDLVEISRVKKTLERFPEKFPIRVFTEAERAYCGRFKHPAERYAARFAAKEAGMKALGTGLSRGVTHRDFEILRSPGRAPEIALHGRAKEIAGKLGITNIRVTMTHSRDTAAAVVIMEKEGV
jgi:holo-[acyl-carrier protein] synthase